MRPNYRTLLALAALLAASGCAHVGVKPWQRDLLSREEMSPDSEALDRRFDAHIHDCRESGSGGRSFIGGAYGCN